MRFARNLVSILLVGLAASAVAAPAPVSGTAPSAAHGRVLASTCVFCHGITDYTVPYPTRHVPRVAGQRYQYILNALKEYADGHRNFPTMHAQAASLTPQQRRDIAAWFSSLKPHPAPSDGSAKAPAFASTCAGCHGARGVSVSPQFPNLAGQYADYILYALKEYKSGKRKNAIMNGMASTLSLAQMKRLAQYFSSQPAAVHILPLAGPS